MSTATGIVAWGGNLERLTDFRLAQWRLPWIAGKKLYPIPASCPFADAGHFRGMGIVWRALVGDNEPEGRRGRKPVLVKLEGMAMGMNKVCNRQEQAPPIVALCYPTIFEKFTQVSLST